MGSPRERRLRLKYNITIEDYDNMLDKQDGLCAICYQTTSKKQVNGHLYVDHCKETNELRGLLCSTCNVGIGMFYHNSLLLDNAIDYLEKYK